MGLAFGGKSSSGSLGEGCGRIMDGASPTPLPPLPPAVLRDQTERSSLQCYVAASRLNFCSLVYSERGFVVLHPHLSQQCGSPSLHLGGGAYAIVPGTTYPAALAAGPACLLIISSLSRTSLSFCIITQQQQHSAFTQSVPKLPSKW